MPAPKISWHVETAGGTLALDEAPQNWHQILMTGGNRDKVYFCGSGSDSGSPRACLTPESGEMLAPQMWTSQKSTGELGLIQVPNYGKSGLNGRYILAIRYDDPDSGPCQIIAKSRIEAWDSQDDLEGLVEPLNEPMKGTKGNNYRSMIRTLDTTRKILDPQADSHWPMDNWWAGSVSGKSDGVYNKDLCGTESYLESDYLIVPPSVFFDTSGASGIAGAVAEMTNIWYISLAFFYPYDAMRGMAEHNFIFNIRPFFV